MPAEGDGSVTFEVTMTREEAGAIVEAVLPSCLRLTREERIELFCALRDAPDGLTRRSLVIMRLVHYLHELPSDEVRRAQTAPLVAAAICGGNGIQPRSA